MLSWLSFWRAQTRGEMLRKFLVVFAIAVFALTISGVTIRGAPAEAAQEPGIAPGSAPPQYPGADNITVYLSCQPDGRVTLNLNWVSYGFGIQYVDLSLFNNGWIFGTFIGQGPLPAYQNQFTWTGLLPNAQHYVRVNTGTQYGWQASQTYVFTTSNCAYNPYPPLCGTYGQPPCTSPGFPPPYNPPCGGYGQPACPPPNCGNAYGVPCPGTPTQCYGTPTFSTYQPGNCPPPGACSVQTAQIMIYPPPAQGCVWTTRGEGATYSLGEYVTYCYWVNQPMMVSISATRPDGSTVQVLPPVWDDGTGGCAFFGNWAGFQPAQAGPPVGPRTAYLSGGLQYASQQLDTTTFTVQ